MKLPPSLAQFRLGDWISGPGAVAWRNLSASQSTQLTYSGRGAIYQYLARLRGAHLPAQRSVVLVPTFHCPTVVDPVLHAGFDVRFYMIDDKLDIVEQDLLRKLDDRTAAVIFIRYFGISALPQRLITACRDAGAKVLEDCCHSFLAANPLQLARCDVDASFYSFWKIVPSLIGGAYVTGEATGSPACRLRRPDRKDVQGRLTTLLRESLTRPVEALNELLGRGQGDAPAAVPAVRKPAAEAYPYVQERSHWRMPWTARTVLARADLQHIADVRRANYQTLTGALAPSRSVSPAYLELPERAVPWGFPLLLQNRPSRDYLIRSRGVPLFTFGEVLHPLLFSQHPDEQSMLDAARYLADTVLAIAIHQQLGAEHMRHFAAIVNELAASWDRSV